MRSVSRLPGQRGACRTGRAMQALLALLVLAICTPSSGQDVRIGVLGLFHAREIVVRAVPGEAVVMRAADRSIVLETSSGMDRVSLRLDSELIAIHTNDGDIRSRSISLTSRDSSPADFLLTLPGKITRRYHGTLEVTPSSASLLMIVTMDLEAAVASVVAAESNPDTPLEALKAQAVATRSYLAAAKGRHDGFDFCDTTHCQFLRTMPDSSTPAARAVVATRGLILAYNAQPFAAMYTRSCSGRTRTPAEIGLPSNGYPYYAVACKHCREHPAAWQSRVTPLEAARLRTSGEAARLEIDRLLGWSAVPSNNFTVKRIGNRVLLEGVGEGHGIGLCQSGAAAMARDGATFTQILAHYYPNTSTMKYMGGKRGM
jgi:stage II sporulation protein D